MCPNGDLLCRFKYKHLSQGTCIRWREMCKESFWDSLLAYGILAVCERTIVQKANGLYEPLKVHFVRANGLWR